MTDRIISILVIVLVCLLLVSPPWSPIAQVEGTVIRLPTPPMGWSTWESFAKNVSEKAIRIHLDILNYTGLRVKGYNIIQIDDGWTKLNRTSGWISRVNYDQAPKNHNGPYGFPAFSANLPPGCMMEDPIKFPSGMKQLGEDIKQQGFKFGLYTSGENFICDSQPGFQAAYASGTYWNLRQMDAACLVALGIDLLKVDMCRPPSFSESYSESVMRAWRKLLPDNVILYNSRYGCLAKTTCGQAASVYRCPKSINFKANRAVKPYCMATSDIARLGPDMKADWSHIISGMLVRIGRGQISRPGHWADPDYLVPDESRLSFEEIRSQFGAWCVMSAPLFISADLTRASKTVLTLLGNTDAIRVNQLYDSDAGDLLWMKGMLWTFGKRLNGNEFAVFVVNVGSTFARSGPRGSDPVTWQPGNLRSYANTSSIAPTVCNAKNVWTGETISLHTNSQFLIGSTDSIFLVVSDCTAAAS